MPVKILECVFVINKNNEATLASLLRNDALITKKEQNKHKKIQNKQHFVFCPCYVVSSKYTVNYKFIISNLFLKGAM